MKSPARSVGIIESEGMRKGSNRNERISSTSRMTGKNERAYSATIGSGACAARFGLSTHASIAQIAPVTKVRMTSSRAKSKTILHPRKNRAQYSRFWQAPQQLAARRGDFGLLATNFEHRQKRLLRNFHLPELFHAPLALLLLLQELALAGHVAAVALGQHVLAQRLHRGAGDDLAADRRLHRHLEHLARDELLHLVDQLAAARIGIVAVNDH